MKMKGMQILNFMGSSNRRLLVHQEMDNIDISDSFDVVLTPQFYTFLREALEIKFAYQAKNIAPAFFDDYLNPLIEHQYHVYKHDGEWYFFAYSVDEIIKFLEEKGLEANQIGKIYFAQELEDKLVKPVQLGKSMAMQTLDNTVTILPYNLIPSDVEYQELNLQKEKFQNGITLSSSYDSIVPFKETAIVTALLFVLGGFFIFEGYRGDGAMESMQVIKNELLEEYPKLSSPMLRESEFDKYDTIDKKERIKRDVLMKISKMIGHNNRLKSLNLTEKSIIATINTASKNDILRIKKMAKKDSFKLSNETSTAISVEKRL